MATKPILPTTAGLQLFKINLADMTIAGVSPEDAARRMIALLAESEALGDGYVEITRPDDEERIAFASHFENFSFA